MKHYVIKKTMVNEHGKTIHVLLNAGYSDEILEYQDKEKAEEFVNIMNANTDSGWVYELIETGK